MISINKYTEIDRGATPEKEYYLDQDGTRVSLTKVELEKIFCDLNLLGIGALTKCSTFLSNSNTTSATKCMFCGNEKFDH